MKCYAVHMPPSTLLFSQTEGAVALAEKFSLMRQPLTMSPSRKFSPRKFFAGIVQKRKNLQYTYNRWYSKMPRDDQRNECREVINETKRRQGEMES